MQLHFLVFHKKLRTDLIPRFVSLLLTDCIAGHFCKFSWCGLWPNILYKRPYAEIFAGYSEKFGIANPHSNLFWICVHSLVRVLCKGSDFRSMRSSSYVLRDDESFRRALYLWVSLPVFPVIVIYKTRLLLINLLQKSLSFFFFNNWLIKQWTMYQFMVNYWTIIYDHYSSVSTDVQG